MSLRSVAEAVHKNINTGMNCIHAGVKYAADSTYGRTYLPRDMQQQLTNDENKTRNVALTILVGAIALLLCFQMIVSIVFTAVQLTVAFGLIYTALNVYDRVVNNPSRQPSNVDVNTTSPPQQDIPLQAMFNVY